MSIIGIVLIALALAMDAFAVSIASGIVIRHHHRKLQQALLIAACFGSFQAFMPFLGWLGGLTLATALCGVDHWIVFGVLTFIGGKMIYESFKFDAVEQRSSPTEFWVLLGLSIATSIDALAAGFSFAMLHIAILTPVLVIGGITFVMSFAGVWIGDRCGHFFEKRIEIIGGLLLIGMGLKTLVDHLASG